MIATKFGHSLDKPLTPLARLISLTGITPNLLTVVGFTLSLGAAVFFVFGNIRLAGLTVLLAGGFDMLDGIVARTTEKITAFGAFLDSVLDRYSDSALFLGLGFYYFLSDSPIYLFIVSATFIGTFLVSYTRARAEGLGLSCNVGLMERPERIMFLAAGSLFDILNLVLWILMILTHITAIQRIHHIWKSVR